MVKPKVMMVDKEFGRLKVIRQAEPLKQNTREAWYLYKSKLHFLKNAIIRTIWKDV